MAKQVVDLLYKAISPAIFNRPYKIIGGKIFVPLDVDRRIEIWLDTAGYFGNYEVIIIKLISKTCGELNCCGLRFKELIGVGKVVSEISASNHKGYRWFGITQKDIDIICSQVSDYISMWE